MKNSTLFVLINMLSGMGYSLVSPLFPTLGKKENLSEEILGWIIGIFPIAGTLFTPIVPILCKKFSRIKLLCFAAFCEASCTILYGLLIFIPNFTILMIIIFTLRIIHGCCSAIIGTLLYSLTISLSNKDETQSSLGKLEIGWAAGTCSGPLFASFFYKLGGYSLPFIAQGMCIYISVYLSLSVDTSMINEEQEDEGEISFLKYLIHPEMYLILFGFVICMINVTFYFPCLTYHLTNNYQLSVSISSLFFIIPIIPYLIILQYLDKISNKFGIYFTFTCGLLLSGFSSIFIFPVPPIPHSVFFIFLGFLMIGLGSVPVFIPGLVLLGKTIKKIDKNIDILSANDISSAINNLTIELGDFLGPIVGGFLTVKFGFKLCCLFVSLLGILYALIFIFFFKTYIQNDIKTIYDKKNSNDIISSFKVETFRMKAYSFHKIRERNNSLHSSLTN